MGGKVSPPRRRLHGRKKTGEHSTHQSIAVRKRELAQSENRSGRNKGLKKKKLKVTG